MDKEWSCFRSRGGERRSKEKDRTRLALAGCGGGCTDIGLLETEPPFSRATANSGVPFSLSLSPSSKRSLAVLLFLRHLNPPSPPPHPPVLILGFYTCLMSVPHLPTTATFHLSTVPFHHCFRCTVSSPP